MVNNNGIPIEINKKPIETVYELKGNEYKVPSFEEFMKDYKVDEKVSESYQTEFGVCNNLGFDKGHGPCSWNNPNCSCYQSELQRQYWVAINNNNTNIEVNITNIWINRWPSTRPLLTQLFDLWISIYGGSDWAEYRWITRIKDGGVGGDSSEWKRATFRSEWVTRCMKIRNIENAKRTLRALESGGISARGGQFGGAAFESTAQNLVASATRQLRNAISRWKNGEKIDEVAKVYT